MENEKTEKLSKEEVKKSLCTITLENKQRPSTVYQDVAGYQLIDNVLVILIQDGYTYLVPTSEFTEATITTYKE
jgi:hypothetical protein